MGVRARVGGALAAVLLEYVLLSFLIDAGIWAQALEVDEPSLRSLASRAVPPIIVVGLVTLGGLLSVAPPSSAGARKPWRGWFGIHGLCLAAWLALCWAVPARLVGAEVAFGAGSFVTLGLATSALCLALPSSVLIRWLGRAKGRMAAAGGLGVGAWLMGTLTVETWNSELGRATFWSVARLLAWQGYDLEIVQEQRLVATELFAVRVAPECSGFEGLGFFFVLAGAFLIWRRRDYRWPAAGLCFALGLLAVWAANVLRIAGLFALGHAGWEEIAIEGFHSRAGWIALGIVSVVWLRGLQAFRHEPSVRGEATWNPAAVYLMPMLATVGVGFVTGMFARDGVDPYFPLRVLVFGGVIWVYRRHYRALVTSPDFVAVLLGVGVGVAWLWVTGEATTTAEAWRSGTSGWSAPAVGLWLAARGIGAIVVAPVAEELAFRGFVLRRLIAADFTAVPFKRWNLLALGASSLLFGMLHADVAAGVGAGLVFALAMLRRGRICDAIVAHAVANAILVAASLWGYLAHVG